MEIATVFGNVRWIFEDYVVYANDRYLADEIHERVRAHRDVRDVFGTMELPTGTGYWVKILRRD